MNEIELQFVRFVDCHFEMYENNKTLTTAEQLNDEMKSSVLGVTVFVGTEACVGFLGNILILYVFAVRYHTCNFRIFVLCLAAIDLTSCLTTVSGEVVTQLYWYIYQWPPLCKVKSFFNVFTVTASAFSLMLISIDRYLKLCKPFGFQFKPRLALLLCIGGLVISAITATPVSIFWGVQHKNKTLTKGSNQTVPVVICLIDDKYLQEGHRKGPEAYSTAVNTILGSLMAVILFNYILIARKMFQLRRKARERSFKPTNKNSNGNDVDSNGIDRSTENATDAASVSSGGKSISQQNPNVQMSKKDNSSDIEDIKVTVSKTAEKHVDTPKPEKSSLSESESHTNRLYDRHCKIVRKTLIMFILSAVFIVTTITYSLCLYFIAQDVLANLSPGGKAGYFFVFRLYFINHVINPFIYGLLDSKFRQIIKDLYQAITSKIKCAKD